jgi:2,4-dienoyl-CoA reductase-like NADH-dependent reductase (Old Yellow Enzyme family)
MPERDRTEVASGRGESLPSGKFSADLSFERNNLDLRSHASGASGASGPGPEAVRAGLRPLFWPLALRGRVLKNRIVSTAHAPGYAEDGMPGERYQAYHEEKARGGLALTMFGGSSIVSGDVTSIYGQIDVSRDAVIPHFRRFAERIHRHGALLMCQISHMGRRTVWDAGDWIAPIAPSPVRDPAHRAMPRAMQEEDIARVIADYGAAARRCAEGGLDGCEVFVTSHLPGQFLSPAANLRADAWGGPLANRMRFLMAILRRVRAAVPEDFVVSLRMSPDESGEGGPDAAECLAVARAARDAGLIDLVNLIGPGGATNASIAQVIPGMALPLAPWLAMAKAFRDAIGLPVLHATRITDLATAAHAVDSGAVDLVGMTRGHVADPHVVRKLLAGQEGRIRPCVGAAYCIDRVYAGKDAVCLHNAATGRETWLPHAVEPAGGSLRAVVVGGGPAGMEAARVLALRGHRVTLFEAAGRLGGQVLLARKAAWRRDLGGIVDWLAAELGHLGVEIRLDAWAEAGDVLALAPDLAIDATGGLPKPLPVPGGELAVSTWDALTTPPEAGRSVLIHDEVGGHQAASLAEFLTRRGCAVELCSPDRLIGRELGASSYPIYLGALARAGARLTPDHALAAVERAGNRLRARLAHEYGGPDLWREVDLVVAECGAEPIPGLFAALKPRSVNAGATDLSALRAGAAQPDLGPGMRLYAVGDAVASRDIHAAILDSLRLCKGL